MTESMASPLNASGGCTPGSSPQPLSGPSLKNSRAHAAVTSPVVLAIEPFPLRPESWTTQRFCSCAVLVTTSSQVNSSLEESNFHASKISLSSSMPLESNHFWMCPGQRTVYSFMFEAEIVVRTLRKPSVRKASISQYPST